MTEKVLFVDDDPQILNGFKRGLRKRFDLKTAEGGAAGLDTLKQDGPFAVVVSDQQMPEMDGISFLRQVKQKSPLTVRMMLTGNADQQTAMDAVNEGHIFRFLTKPCAPEDLAVAVEAAQQQYRLVSAERELLEKTLAGSVKVLVDVLSLSDPDAFKEIARLQRWGQALAKAIKLDDAWALNMATMLHGIGRITLPDDVTAKLRSGGDLNEVEADMVARTPETARDLIKNIPRLEGVAQAVYYQSAGYDGSGFPGDGTKGADLPIEARILRILIDLACTSTRDKPGPEIFDRLAKTGNAYDPEILKAARACLTPEESAGTEAPPEPEVLKVQLHQLTSDHKLVEDAVTETDVLVLAAGHRLSRPMIQKLQQYHKLRTLKMPLSVVQIAPEDEEEAAADQPQA
ncbi:response regulator [Pelagibius litoralis]|uniref:Response regulator n=1 Tax=Pelagibius litoralis TaxID=374515 RepID=A0A967K9G9_9PROT|nr:HD domain-containing phosphohydrolase [Pelagibius litoralis]NIA69314.1 response regulator [Pelagibius litoralis]